MLLKIIDTIIHESGDYKLNESLCTRIISPKSTCDNCTKFCPISCIKLTDKIVIDNSCINCGICSSKCPTGAIVMKTSVLEYLHYEIIKGNVLSLGCMKKKTSRIYFKNFCLGIFPDEFILYLLLVRPSWLNDFDTSKCEKCELSSSYVDYKNRKDKIERTLNKLDIILNKTPSRNKNVNMDDCDYNKREFIKSLFKIKEIINDTHSENNKKFHFHQLYKELLDLEQRLYNVIDIYFPQKSGECSQCGACIKLCPSKALRLEKASIYLDISQCSGCGLCENVCYDKALVMGTLPIEQFVQTSIKIIEGE